jgi:hypothetical protein
MTSALTLWCCTYKCIASDASKTAATVPAELDILSNIFDNAIWSGSKFAKAQGQGEKGREQLQHARRAHPDMISGRVPSTSAVIDDASQRAHCEALQGGRRPRAGRRRRGAARRLLHTRHSDQCTVGNLRPLQQRAGCAMLGSTRRPRGRQVYIVTIAYVSSVSHFQTCMAGNRPSTFPR